MTVLILHAVKVVSHPTNRSMGMAFKTLVFPPQGMGTFKVKFFTFRKQIPVSSPSSSITFQFYLYFIVKINFKHSCFDVPSQI